MVSVGGLFWVSWTVRRSLPPLGMRPMRSAWCDPTGSFYTRAHPFRQGSAPGATPKIPHAHGSDHEIRSSPAPTDSIVGTALRLPRESGVHGSVSIPGESRSWLAFYDVVALFNFVGTPTNTDIKSGVSYPLP